MVPIIRQAREKDARAVNHDVCAPTLTQGANGCVVRLPQEETSWTYLQVGQNPIR